MDKIREKKDVPKFSIHSAYRRPLNELNRTLESYEITRTITLSEIIYTVGGKLNI